MTRFADEPPARREGTAVVAVAPGAGVAELFAAEGVLLADGTEDAVLAAVLAAGTGAAVVLPGRAELTAPADAAAARARDAGVEVAVVPTRSPVQGLAAVAVHDEAPPVRRRRDRDGRGRGGDPVGRGVPGHPGRADHGRAVPGRRRARAGRRRGGDRRRRRCRRSRASCWSGCSPAAASWSRSCSAAAEAALADRLERQVARDHPGVEVSVHGVPQPDVPLLIGVE